MWRVHLSSDDLTRVRIAPAADPMWEIQLSVHTLARGDGEVVFDAWRREIRHSGVQDRWGSLLQLAPPQGYTPDFLTPVHGNVSLEEGIDAVLRTPAAALLHDLRALSVQRPLPEWGRHLAAGDPATLSGLGRVLRGYFDDALAPHWFAVSRQVDDERQRLIRALATGGVEHLLQVASPLLRWEAPVLHLVGKRTELDVHLDGRGLVLVPSFFAFDDVTPVPALRGGGLGGPDDSGAPLVLVFPISHALGWASEPVAAEDALGRLAPVLGRARARAMIVLGDAPRTTSELAASLGFSVASASQHAKALRAAGLVLSAPEGRSVVHRLTSLGLSLLENRPAI